MTEPTPIIIDTDPGVDDALALAMAASCDELQVVAITSGGGNVPAAMAAENAGRLARLFGDPPPVGIGRDVGANALFIHGKDGLAGQASRFPQPLEPAGASADLLVECARERSGELVVIATGPITNVADALERAGDFAADVKRLIWMGGAFAAPGNVSAGAEFNAWHDPDSLRAVLGSDLDVTIVPLDVTTAAPVGPALQRSLRGNRSGPGALGSAFAEMLDQYARNCRRPTDAGTIQHDSVAVALAAWPELFRVERHHVEVQTGPGPAQGMTIFDRRPASRRGEPNVHVALGIDAGAFERRFLERVLQTMEAAGD